LTNDFLFDLIYLKANQFMTILEAEELSNVLEASRSIPTCSQVDELQKEALRVLEKIFTTTKGCFFLVDTAGERFIVDRCITRNISEEYVSCYSEYYCQIDPMSNGISRPLSVEPNVITLDQVIPYREFTRTEFYNDFYRPQSIYYEMDIHLKTGRRQLGGIGLYRPKDANNFSPQEKVKAELIAPILTGALGQIIFADRIAQCEGIINSLTQDLPYKGIIIFDESLNPIYVNEDAKEIMASLSQREECRKSPYLWLPKELIVGCQELIRNAKGKRSPGMNRQQINLAVRSGGQSIGVYLHLIKYPDRSPLVAIYLDQKEPIFYSCECLRKFGLTGREVEVASLVCEGLRNNEIAERLFISEYTVINHLRAIYEKLGVKNRTSLIHRVIHQEPPEINY
jgi:DNA-binding CsgD family transcriptional regulator